MQTMTIEVGDGRFFDEHLIEFEPGSRAYRENAFLRQLRERLCPDAERVVLPELHGQQDWSAPEDQALLRRTMKLGQVLLLEPHSPDAANARVVLQQIADRRQITFRTYQIQFCSSGRGGLFAKKNRVGRARLTEEEKDFLRAVARLEEIADERVRARCTPEQYDSWDGGIQCIRELDRMLAERGTLERYSGWHGMVFVPVYSAPARQTATARQTVAAA